MPKRYKIKEIQFLSYELLDYLMQYNCYGKIETFKEFKNGALKYYKFGSDQTLEGIINFIILSLDGASKGYSYKKIKKLFYEYTVKKINIKEFINKYFPNCENRLNLTEKKLKKIYYKIINFAINENKYDFKQEIKQMLEEIEND
jgi:hypothetical protein